MLQIFIHYGFHFLVPLLFAFLLNKKHYKKTYLILLCTMLIDIDHILASPVFLANRCSIGYHFFHTVYFFPIYIALLFCKNNWRIIGIGLCWHIITDFVDCIFIYKNCVHCVLNQIF
jgi:hypothetical protein